MVRLRQVFASDKTLSKAWRMDQLNAMMRMMTEGRKELQKAMYADLHKSAFECNITELDLTISEISYALHHLDEWMAEHPAAISPMNHPGAGATVFDPLGVVLIMGAWNYPALLTFSPLVGAIAAGNCAVIKPGSYAPETSHAMARLITRYMDKDAIMVCEGNRDLTDALLNERFDCIFYTGSGYVGKIVAKAAAEHLCPVILELGGKSPLIVHKSADLDLAASRFVWGSFLNSGQTCIRPDHVLVDASVGEAFLKLCKAKITEYYSDDVQKTEWFGRIINESAFDRLQGILDESRARIYTGGKSDRADKFVEPTLLNYGTDAKAFDESAAMKDEIFGPIAPVLFYTDYERDVIQRIRELRTGKPLALYLFAEDANVVEDVKRRLTSGGMCVNDCLMHLANHCLPFGGVGQSGMGSYHGFRSMKSFSHEKAVLTKFSALDQSVFLKSTLAVRYPPYTSQKQFLVTLLSNPSIAVVMEYAQMPALQRVLLFLIALFVGKKLGFRLARD